MMSHSRRFVTVGLLLVGLVIVALTGKSVLRAAGDYLIVEDSLQHVDLIHVLSGPDHRNDYAIKLAQQGYSQRLFFTGGWCPTIQANHAEHARELAIAQGISSHDIAIDGSEVTSTYDEVLRLRDYINRSQTPITSVLVVSDPYHMRRARWAYRHVLGEQVELLMRPVPFTETPIELDWWSDHHSAEMVFSEYGKLVYYYVRYEVSQGVLQRFLASFDKH